MEVAVLLSGRLKLDGYGRGRLEDTDGTYPLAVRDGSTVQQTIHRMGVPSDRVAMIMVNGHRCDTSCQVKAHDRVILIPQDVAILWRALCRQNMGAESILDF